MRVYFYRFSRLLFFTALILQSAFSAPSSADDVSVGAEEQPDLLHYVKRVDADLRGNILPFWLEHTRDTKRGGFFGEIDVPLVVRENAPRGALLTSRVLWTFSAAYRRYHEPAYLEMARWAYDDLIAHFWDHENGGVYWRISADGAPIDARKVLYVQAFAMYGLSEFYRATEEQAPLRRAEELYRLIEAHCRDGVNKGYFEEFSRDWKVSRDRGRRNSAMGSTGQKSQNVHLHLMEAYANLYRAAPNAELKANLREIVLVLLDRVLDPSNHHLRLFMDEDWKPASDEISFGHDIEFSWLLTETTDLLGDADLSARARAEALEIARVTLEEGVAPDGGILAEADPHGITNTFKEWWPQAEAVVGFFNAYQLSGETKYRDASLRRWRFIEEQLIDRKNGEWLIGIGGNRRTAPVKAGFWKCPYHNGRAGLEFIERASRSAR